MKTDKIKRILGSAIILITVLFCTAYQTKGVWVSVGGNLLDEYWNAQFSQEQWQERAKAQGDFENKLISIVVDTFHENAVSFGFSFYASRDNQYIETDANDPDFLEKALDEMEADGEMNGVEWYVYMLYIKSTNEFVYREKLPEDSQLHIDYDAVEAVVTGDSDDMEKMENACRVVAGENLQEENASNNVTAYIIGAVMAVVLCVVLIILYYKRKEKKAKATENEK